MLAKPRQASAMPARPTPNFFSAARRVTDWAMLFVISSNLSFITFLSFLLFFGLLVVLDSLPYDLGFPTGGHGGRLNCRTVV